MTISEVVLSIGCEVVALYVYCGCCMAPQTQFHMLTPLIHLHAIIPLTLVRLLHYFAPNKTRNVKSRLHNELCA